MAEKSKYTRQPIVSVLGHVDHGKTSLLDFIRGSTVADRESGAITQHIGATEVPIGSIYEICGCLLKQKKFTLPGLLFIDTPGHHAFTTLRSRGGSLADIAILIVDVTEGFKPQTYEALNILKQYKTPFIIAANKIDKISGWQKTEHTAKKRIESQPPKVQGLFDENIYEMIGTLFDNKIQADLYYKIADFKKTVGIIPISAKTGEGISELLMVLVGLAQRFLEDKLHIENGPGKGTVLEVKEEIGLGTTLDTIVYNGHITNDDTIVIGTKNEPVVRNIRALLKPKPLDEIRDPREKFENIKEVHAASGIKINCPDLQDVLPGAPVRVAEEEKIDEIIEEIKKQSKIELDLDESGIVIKADTIGSLEALIKESKDKGIQIRKAEIGDVSKRDIIETDATEVELNKVIFAFNVKVLPDAKEELSNVDIKIFNEDVIYTIMENYDEWIVQKKTEMEDSRRKDFTHPGMMKFLPDYVFRINNPAVIGVRVITGRIKPGTRLIREDGKPAGKIKSIQSDGQPVEEAKQGEEVAVSIDGVTVGRQIKRNDILYTDMPGSDAKKLKEMDVLTIDEKDLLEKITTIKRKTDRFWGM